MQKPLEVFASIIVKEYCSLRNHQSRIDTEGKINENNISMCAFFDNVKTQLLELWEFDIVKKSTSFKTQKASIV